MGVVKQVIVVRKDLKCRRGKMMAQVAHASMKVILDLMSKKKLPDMREDWSLLVYTNTPLYKWLNGSFTKVVVGVDSLEELLQLRDKAEEQGIMNAIIEDEGRTEFHGEKTITCIAIGPDYSEEIDKVTGNLKLL